MAQEAAASLSADSQITAVSHLTVLLLLLVDFMQISFASLTFT